VATVWAAAAAGGVLAVVALATHDAAGPASPAAPAARQPGPKVGDRLETSFGSLSVDYVVRLVGTDTPMGVRVGAREIPVQIGVTMTNLEHRSVRITPQAFRLPGAGQSIVDVGRLPGDRLEALRAHRWTLRYAAPAGAALPALQITDPGRPSPVAVALGSPKGLVELDVTTHRFSKPRTR
jgi:hypothetical protein